MGSVTSNAAKPIVYQPPTHTSHKTGSAVLQHDALMVTVLAFVSAYLAIAIFMKVLERMSLLPFVIYRLCLGVGLMIYMSL